MMIGCHVCATVCVCVSEVLLWVCVERSHLKAQQFRRMTLPQKPEALPHYPQCSARWLINPSPQRWKWEENSWFECLPPSLKEKEEVFFYLFVNCKSLWVSVSSVTKGKTKRKRYACVDDGKALLWHIVIMALGNHTAVPLCVCAGKGNWKEKFQVGDLRWDKKRKRKKESVQVKSSKNDTIWNIYNVIIYEVLMSEVTANLLFPVGFLWRI